MSRAPRQRRSSSIGSRFGSSGGGRQMQTDLAVTIKSYHFDTSPEAKEEDNYMIASLIGSGRHFRDVYAPGTEFKVFMPPAPPLADQSRVPRNTIRRLSKKTAMGFSTGDALTPGSDVLLRRATFEERNGEVIILAHLGVGLLNGEAKKIVLTDEGGVPEEEATLCGKTYANVKVVVRKPREVPKADGDGTRSIMSANLLFPERGSVLSSSEDLMGQIAKALYAHTFEHEDEDEDWGLRGVNLYAVKKASDGLSDEQQKAFYVDFDNAPTMTSLFVSRIRSGESEGNSGDLQPWSEDGMPEIQASLQRFVESDYSDQKKIREFMQKPEDYLFWVVPVVQVSFMPSMVPGYVSPEGIPLRENFFEIGSLIEGDEVYQNGEPAFYQMPGRNQTIQAFFNTERVEKGGVISFSALTVTRHVAHYDSLPLNENTLVAKEPYETLKKAPFKILNYAVPTISRADIPLVLTEQDDSWASINVPRQASLLLDDMVIAGLPEAYIAAHEEGNKYQRDLAYSFKVEHELVRRPDNWPEDDGSGDAVNAEGGDAPLLEAEKSATKTAPSTPAQAQQSGWDAGTEAHLDDDIPF